MRVAVVSHTSVHWTGPYAGYLASHGHEVRVLSFSRDPLDGIDVEYVGGGTPARLKIASHLARVPPLRRALRRFGADVVLAPYLSSNGMAAALAWRGPLVVSARGGDVLRQAGYLPGGSVLHRHMMRLVCGRASVVHVVSSELADELVASGVSRDRIACFPFGVDVDVFVPPERQSPHAPPRVICTRRHEPVYGTETVVQALAALRDRGVSFAATLVGGGPELEARRAQVHELGLGASVRLIGQVSRDDVRRLLQDADVFVSASTSDGTSSSLLEAMACGLFPVVTDIRANREWVEDGETGLVFAPGDPLSLATALTSALDLDGGRWEPARTRNRGLVVRTGNVRTNMRRMEQLLTRASDERSRPDDDDAVRRN